MLRATFIEKKKQGKADMDRERPANKAPFSPSLTSALLGHFRTVQFLRLVAEVVVVVVIGTFEAASRNLVIEAAF